MTISFTFRHKQSNTVIGDNERKELLSREGGNVWKIHFVDAEQMQRPGRNG